MLVLVTGCTGRIGPSVLKDLASSGYNIRGLLEPGCQVPDGARDYLDQIQYGDIRNAEDWRKALEDVDAVVHLAAISADVPGVFDTNVASTRAMTQICHEVGVRSIVYASSSCVLGQCDRQGNPPFELEFLPVDETHPLNPNPRKEGVGLAS